MKKIMTLIFGMGFLFLTAMACAQGTQEAQDTFTYKLGDFEISLLAESQGEINPSILIGATPAMLEECAPDGVIPNAMNAFLVKTPEWNVLVDAGLGRKLFDNLESLGVKPEEIDFVLITHMHGDHIGGLMRDGKVMFPNAEMYLPHPEHNYWVDSERGDQAREVIAAYRSKMHLFSPFELGEAAEPLMPGFTAYAAYGHTPGHSLFMVESDGEKLLIWGDLTHATAVQMPYPQVAVTYDTNPDDAIASRKQVLEYVATHNIPIAGMHIAYPSIGSVARNNSGGFVFKPVLNP